MKHFKLGANAERHMKKYAGTTEEDYLAFAARTARRVTLSRFDQEICDRLGIYSIAHLGYVTTPLPIVIQENEVDDYLLEHSVNPLEIVQMWQKAKGDATFYQSKESIIDEYLKPFPKESFERFGDKNWLSDVNKGWFNRNGLALDVHVQEMNTMYELDITTDDVIEFVRLYKPNSYKSPALLRLEQIEDKFKELTSFQLKEYYAEHLMLSCFPNYQPEEEPLPF